MTLDGEKYGLALSTSSPLVSACLFRLDGEVLWKAEELSHHNASEVCAKLLDRSEEVLRASGIDFRLASIFCADLGPGSFTGVRIGVTLIQTFAFASGRPACGLSAFELYEDFESVAIPLQKGKWWLRNNFGEPTLVSVVPNSLSSSGKVCGWGDGIQNEVFPSASVFAKKVSLLTPVSPEKLLPIYMSEPRISTPKIKIKGLPLD